MTYATIATEVDIDMGDFSTAELMEELQSRGEIVSDEVKNDILGLYEHRIITKCCGGYNDGSFDERLDDFFRKYLGKGL